MGGYGIVGANVEMGQALAALGWREEAPGFYLLHASGMRDLVKTVHALDAYAVPAGCRLFSVGEVVDLGREMGADAPTAHDVPSAARDEGFPFTAPIGGPADAVGASGSDALPFALSAFDGGGMQGGPVPQPQGPVDPLEQMLASGYFDDDDDDLTDDAAEAVRRSQKTEDAAGPTPETPDGAASDDDDDYSLEMMRMYGLR